MKPLVLVNKDIDQTLLGIITYEDREHEFNKLVDYTQRLAVKKLIRKLPPIKTILEFGAGCGRWRDLLEGYDEYIGIERDPQFICEDIRTWKELFESDKLHFNGRPRLFLSITALQHNKPEKQIMYVDKIIDRYNPEWILLIEHQRPDWKADRTHPRKNWLDLFPNYEIVDKVGVWFNCVWPVDKKWKLWINYAYQYIAMKILPVKWSKHIGVVMKKK